MIAVDLLLLALGAGGVLVPPVGTGDGVDCLTSPAFLKEEGAGFCCLYTRPQLFPLLRRKLTLLLSLCQ